MGRRKKESQESTRQADCIVPAPYNQVYPPRNPQEDRLITALLQAAEKLADPYRDPEAPRSHAPFAKPPTDAEPPVDLSELLDLLARLQSLLARDARLREFLAQLFTAFGDETTVRVLLRNLFPELRPAKPQCADGKPLLSKREIEILRELARDLSHVEIADRLFISSRTVGTHLKNIYNKLGVSKPMQAVARAIFLGYLDLDALNVAEATNSFPIRYSHAFSTHFSFNGGLHSEPKAAPLIPFAQLSLLLMTLSHLASGLPYSDTCARSSAHGIVCEVSESDAIKRAFGADYLHYAYDLTVAPPQAARQGFTPGNLFVLSRALSVQGLNSAEIVEFNPEGQFVRAFRGSQELGTRLVNPAGLAFSADGRLLVSVGGITDAILAFGDSGATVERFADGCFAKFCVGSNGKVYAPLRSGVGSIIKVFDPCGRLLQTIGSTPPSAHYDSVALDSRGFVFLNRIERGKSVIEVFDAQGRLQNTLSGFERCFARITCDPQDHLFLPCRNPGVLTILTRDGEMIRQIDLSAKFDPESIALGKGGVAWVCGSVNA